MQKKYCALILFLVTVIGAYSLVYAGTALYGDLNGDGEINSFDVTLMNRYIMEERQLENLTLADLNGDGMVDTLDYALLKRYLLEIIDGFPVGSVFNPGTSPGLGKGEINLGSNITYSGEGISVNGSIVRISAGGEYTIAGTLTNGMLHVNTSGEVTLRLKGVSISNSNGPAIYVEKANKANIILENGTINTLNDGSSSIYDTGDAKVKGVISSNPVLVIDGKGTLNVRANYEHGIISYSELYIKDGNINVQSAVTDGIHAKDYMEIAGGKLDVTADSDGIDCKGNINIKGGTFNISAVKHGVAAEGDITLTDGYITINAQKDGFNSEANMIMKGGTINIKAGEQGIDTTGSLRVDNGAITLECPEDGINITGSITINGGTINALSYNEDAIDSNESIVITGGVFDLRSGKDGIAADYDITIENGLFSIRVESDGIEADRNLEIFGGEFNIFAKDDGLHSSSDLVIHDGIFNIKDGYEGIESGEGAVIVNGGEITIEAGNDGINAQRDVTINGGNIYINIQRGDGIDSNGTVHINGGYMFIVASGSPEGSIDTDGATFSITGGTVIGMGGNVGQITREATTQPVLVLGGASANSTIVIRSNNNVEVANFTVPRTFSTLIFTSPELRLNTTYTMYVNGNPQRTFTTSSIVTVDGGIEFNPFGGFPGGGWGGGFPGGDWGGGFPGGDWGGGGFPGGDWGGGGFPGGDWGGGFPGGGWGGGW